MRMRIAFSRLVVLLFAPTLKLLLRNEYVSARIDSYFVDPEHQPCKSSLIGVHQGYHKDSLLSPRTTIPLACLTLVGKSHHINSMESLLTGVHIALAVQHYGQSKD